VFHRVPSSAAGRVALTLSIRTGPQSGRGGIAPQSGGNEDRPELIGVEWNKTIPPRFVPRHSVICADRARFPAQKVNKINKLLPSKADHII
jgi:hypothetical protein